MQPDGYRHDYTAIEERLRQLAAPADRHRMIGQGLRALAVCVGLCAVMLSGALAWRIAQAPTVRTVVEERVVERAVPAPGAREEQVPPPGLVPAQAAADEPIVTTDFVLFRETAVEAGGQSFEVTAGHEYRTETDTSFSHAWCYTAHAADGVHLRVPLGEMASGSAPARLPASGATLEAAGLTHADHETLFQACPWLEGNPNLAQARAGASVYAFTGEVTTESVDRLLAAVEAGATLVRLASPGGHMDEAMRGHRALVRARVGTVASGECASACTILFLAGRERTVEAGGSIGVHQWRSGLGDMDEEGAQLVSADLVRLIAEAGVAADFYVVGARTPSDTLYTLSPHELRSWGVVRAAAGG